jgi:hypothetical protein
MQRDLYAYPPVQRMAVLCQAILQASSMPLIKLMFVPFHPQFALRAGLMLQVRRSNQQQILLWRKV